MWESQIIGEVTCLPSASARIAGDLAEFARWLFEDFEDALANEAGVSKNNHVIYKVDQPGKLPLYIQFHDSTVIFGRFVVEE